MKGRKNFKLVTLSWLIKCLTIEESEMKDSEGIKLLLKKLKNFKRIFRPGIKSLISLMILLWMSLE